MHQVAYHHLPRFIEEFPHFNQKLIGFAKSTAIIGSLAAASLVSFAIAYLSPAIYLASTLSVSIFTLSSLSKLIERGNHRWARRLMAVAFIAVGTLALGGGAFIAYYAGQTLLASIQALNISGMIWSSFFLTGITGYALPLSLNFLQKAYTFLTDPVWINKLNHLSQKFSQLPEFSRFWTNLSNQAKLWLALIYPQIFRGIIIEFDLQTHPRILATMNTAFSSFESFENILEQIKSLFWMAQVANQPLPPDLKPNFYEFFKASLEIIEPAKQQQTVNILLDNIVQLVPTLMNTEEFLELFQNDLFRILKQKMQQFIENEAVINRVETAFNDLGTSLQELETQIENDLQPIQREALQNRLHVLQQDFNVHKQKIERIYRDKQRWQNFLALPNLNIQTLMQLLPDIEALISMINDPQLNQHITHLYQKAMGIQAPRVARADSFAKQIQRLANKLAQEENQAQQTCAWEFLGAERCEFKLADYEELQIWLKAKTLEEIESKMEEIGLKTEDDLYMHKILPRQEIITKEQVKINLKSYIEQQFAKPHNWKARIYRILSLEQLKTSWGQLSKKITQMIYRLSNMAMVVAPTLLSPSTTLAGIGGGFVFFTLKKLKVRHALNMGNFFDRLAHNNTEFRLLRNTYNLTTKRSFFILNSNTRNRMQKFARIDLFAKMRLLNMELFITILVTYLGLIIGLGGFLQGISLGKELSYLF